MAHGVTQGGVRHAGNQNAVGQGSAHGIGLLIMKTS
jgi:hypothetical protein